MSRRLAVHTAHGNAADRGMFTALDLMPEETPCPTGGAAIGVKQTTHPPYLRPGIDQMGAYFEPDTPTQFFPWRIALDFFHGPSIGV